MGTDTTTDRPGRCHSCDDKAHLASEHCWYEGDTCRCGETPLWDVNPVNPCPMINGAEETPNGH